jgi:DNA polymerase-1
VLEELAADHELPRLILDYRGMAKLKSTYTDKLPQQIDTSTGRIHTSYHQAVAATGRLSSSDPNLQNIPIRTPEGRRIRQAFIAPPGHLLMAADYSQIELRIMAHLSADPALLRAFADGRDVHPDTAAEVFGVALDDVSSDQRRSAKAINFGIVYGMGASRLANDLRIARSEAQAYIDGYFARYPQVRAYMEGACARARETGYAETLYGRRRPVSGLDAGNPMDRATAERVAINTPIQGSAADIVMCAMLKVWRCAELAELGFRMQLQVHDELILEGPEANAPRAMERVVELMSRPFDKPLLVDLVVDAKVVTDWGSAK